MKRNKEEATVTMRRTARRDRGMWERWNTERGVCNKGGLSLAVYGQMK